MVRNWRKGGGSSRFSLVSVQFCPRMVPDTRCVNSSWHLVALTPFFIFSSQKAEQFLIEDMETECIFGLHVVCILAICCVVHFGDSLALYRVILALRRRQHGPSATSPSVGGKTR